MTFGLIKGQKLCNVIMRNLILAKSDQNFLCFAGNAHMHGLLQHAFSHFRNVGNHFKQSVDMLIRIKLLLYKPIAQNLTYIHFTFWKNNINNIIKIISKFSKRCYFYLCFRCYFSLVLCYIISSTLRPYRHCLSLVLCYITGVFLHCLRLR